MALCRPCVEETGGWSRHSTPDDRRDGECDRCGDLLGVMHRPFDEDRDVDVDGSDPLP